VKLDYVNKIERGEMTVKGVAKLLDIKEATVATWLGKKRQKPDDQKRQKRVDRDELDSDCLNIE
jgi:transposase